MDFEFAVSASLSRVEGKFASRDEMEEQLLEALEGADPGSLTGEQDGEYEVTDWSVMAQAPVAGKKPEAKNVNRDRLIADDLKDCLRLVDDARAASETGEVDLTRMFRLMSAKLTDSLRLVDRKR